MKSALSDFILGKKGIYGILHIIILLMSLFLVISISIDTFKGIPFYTQSSYMKIQLWICIWFLFDFVLEFFLAKHKWRYIRTHFIFLLVAIPYQNIIAYYGWTFSPEVLRMESLKGRFRILIHYPVALVLLYNSCYLSPPKIISSNFLFCDTTITLSLIFKQSSPVGMIILSSLTIVA